MATNFRFLKFRFFRRNSETTRDGHVVPGKENVGNFLFSRVAPFVMTSDDPESRNCFRFVLLLLLLRVRSTQKVRDRFSSFFSPAGRPTGVDDCCRIGLLSPTLPQERILSFSDICRPIRTLFCYAEFPFVRFVV